MGDRRSKPIYRVKTIEEGPSRWEWEIVRNEQPLDARLRDGPFKTQRTALAAGTVALKEFLKLLEREQSAARPFELPARRLAATD